MKIPAISGYNNNYYYLNRNNSGSFATAKEPIEKKSSFMSFLGKSKVSKNLANRIGKLIPEMKHGDILTVGGNIKTVQEGLLKTVALYSGAIKRILHINAGLAIPIAFSQDDYGDFSCYNLGDRPFAIVKGEDHPEVPNRHFAVEPEEYMPIEEGDVIVNGNNEIKIIDWLNDYAASEDMPLDFPDPAKVASKIYDYEDLQAEQIEKTNRTILTKLLQEKEEETKKAASLSFKDVGGLDKVIDNLKKSVVYPIKYPFAYENVALNRGILLYGPPGTGKTLLAESLAGECDAHYTKICGSDLETKWVGETEERWRALFETAKQNQPAIIFIDEFDSVAKSRDGANNSEHGAKVVNQILALMSDLEKGKENVFVIAATNKPALFDNAIMRSGRFGKQIEVTAPDREGLDAIFEIHTRNKKLDANLDVAKLLDDFYARKMTGADIKHVVNEAHVNSWIRTDVYKKMEEGILTPADMEEVAITREDFDSILNQITVQKVKTERRKIGY